MPAVGRRRQQADPAGAKYEIDIDEQVSWSGEVFRVWLPNPGTNGDAVTVTITQADDGRQRLRWNCSACELGSMAARVPQYGNGCLFAVCNYEQVLRDLLAIERALDGLVRDHHRFLLKVLLDQLDQLTTTIDHLSQRIAAISPESFRAAVRLVRTADGLQQRTAENVLAETGIDMSPFPSAKHLSSWAVVCPGNNESAGKRKSGKTARGNRWLRGARGEAACAGARTKNTYLRRSIAASLHAAARNVRSSRSVTPC